MSEHSFTVSLSSDLYSHSFSVVLFLLLDKLPSTLTLNFDIRAVLIRKILKLPL